MDNRLNHSGNGWFSYVCKKNKLLWKNKKGGTDDVLIIHFLTKDGIVAISDKRTTIGKNAANTHYMDTTTKTIAFPNMVVVSHCGDNCIDKDKKITV